MGAPPKTHFSPAWMPSFCAAQLRAGVVLPGTETQDLGHRTVEGLDAVGVLQKRALQIASNTGENSGFKPRSSVTETWCSEDSGAVILRIIGTEERGDNQSFAMVNIQRGEPDAALFEIPPDYRVLEKVNKTPARAGSGVIGGVGPWVAEPVSAPSKPSTSE